MKKINFKIESNNGGSDFVEFNTRYDGNSISEELSEELSDEISENDWNLPSKEEEKISETSKALRGYESNVEFYTDVNKAIFAILFNYFNILKYEKLNDVKNTNKKIEFRGLIGADNTYMSYLPEFPPQTFNFTIHLIIDGVDVLMVLTAFNDGGGIRNVARLSSSGVIEMSGSKIYKMIFKEAIDVSNLKGNYLVLSDNQLNWEINDLKDLSFEDVFLPKPLMEDLDIYIKLFETKGILSRYMFNGIPGTGKTESTRAMSKILNKQGVTIIKTNICEIIKEKFDLAKILAPSLILLDDIDLYLGDRNRGGVSKMLGMFLDILDGVDKLPTDVGVIATTNAPHLIDLAAQRPGRFNKLLFFDELTEENIKNIILKSLSLMSKEYNNVTKEDEKILTDDMLIKFFKEENSTGAFIFETIKNIKHKIDILGEKLDLVSITAEIKKNNKLLTDKLKVTRIKSEFDKSPNKMGY